MLKLTRKSILHTVILVGILFLQLAGAFNGLNRLINSSLSLVEGPLINVLTDLGGDVFLIPFTALVLLLHWRKGKISQKTIAFIVATFLGLAVVVSLKVLIAELRPRSLPGASFLSKGAFPSGHAFRAAIIASYVSDRWKKLWPVAWAYAIGIALTRLLLHYHWFSDVLFSLFFAPWLYYLVRSILGRNDVA